MKQFPLLVLVVSFATAPTPAFAQGQTSTAAPAANPAAVEAIARSIAVPKKPETAAEWHEFMLRNNPAYRFAFSEGLFSSRDLRALAPSGATGEKAPETPAEWHAWLMMNNPAYAIGVTAPGNFPPGFFDLAPNGTGDKPLLPAKRLIPPPGALGALGDPGPVGSAGK